MVVVPFPANAELDSELAMAASASFLCFEQDDDVRVTDVWTQDD